MASKIMAAGMALSKESGSKRGEISIENDQASK
jgi:hypothetical protein